MHLTRPVRRRSQRRGGLRRIVSSGRTHAWSSPGGSSFPVSALLFGEFDDVPGTDIVAVEGGRWAITRCAGTRSGAATPWAKLNNKLTGSFSGAVAADFDGNGKANITFNDGSRWYYSRDGRASLALLRDDPPASRVPGAAGYPPLKAMLIGRFEGGKRAGVVAFERKPSIVPPGTVPGERLVIWRGVGSGDDFSLLSSQNMR
jgi:hypothetical protein